MCALIELRVRRVEKPPQGGLDQLDRDTSVPDALRQTPAEIVENFPRGSIGEVQANVLSQFPEQRQRPRHRDAPTLLPVIPFDWRRQPGLDRRVGGQSRLGGLRRPLRCRAKQRSPSPQ